ncbi:transcription factor with AP2 domain(s), putative [Plasmodium berghei]|uniref:AP2 domain transcription factor AP2-I, putative n=2 Tax=Plasmodium berghei TaxID=5821 RepID=A0A509ATM1_PLABA|nr:AP2 domain transcription factor AP2-I, putative [Plasmodium berghei ANKA]CXI73591.1 transcription factor with AP2 domain(s), putative [Plasmodium berghei]SCM24571.1 transcription factor with AP2 domain(s), putative [Plasmodium berghei]SCN27103.1 transcription factor with AP2 domain(s), putative [Plasmodium berghei]SCO61607.1 transcription factor with AP2 domain(s), putative [Plasmodium berghei]SCO63525.1 transcription factor with AP2 domain(s), putative [Plasmodium berghei]|eukprot:XP_034422737.1 AP2 domain transcription factor AP2-I, putative [Plasmodium berghei ANKA]
METLVNENNINTKSEDGNEHSEKLAEYSNNAKGGENELIYEKKDEIYMNYIEQDKLDVPSLVEICKQQLIVILKDMCTDSNNSDEKTSFLYHLNRLRNALTVVDLHNYIAVFGPCLSYNKLPSTWNISVCDYLKQQLNILRAADSQQNSNNYMNYYDLHNEYEEAIINKKLNYVNNSNFDNNNNKYGNGANDTNVNNNFNLANVMGSSKDNTNLSINGKVINQNNFQNSGGNTNNYCDQNENMVDDYYDCLMRTKLPNESVNNLKYMMNSKQDNPNNADVDNVLSYLKKYELKSNKNNTNKNDDVSKYNNKESDYDYQEEYLKDKMLYDSDMDENNMMDQNFMDGTYNNGVNGRGTRDYDNNGNNLIGMNSNNTNINNKNYNIKLEKIKKNDTMNSWNKPNTEGHPEYLPRIPGVRFNPKKQQWLAAWNDNTREIRKYFSVKQYGFEQARILAVKARQEAEKAGARCKPMFHVHGRKAIDGISNELIKVSLINTQMSSNEMDPNYNNGAPNGSNNAIMGNNCNMIMANSNNLGALQNGINNMNNMGGGNMNTINGMPNIGGMNTLNGINQLNGMNMGNMNGENNNAMLGMALVTAPNDILTKKDLLKSETNKGIKRGRGRPPKRKLSEDSNLSLDEIEQSIRRGYITGNNNGSFNDNGELLECMDPYDKDCTRPMKGVSYNDRKGSWLAYWSIGKIFQMRRFPIKKLGFEKAKELAIQCRLEAEQAGATTTENRNKRGRNLLNNNSNNNLDSMLDNSSMLDHDDNMNDNTNGANKGMNRNMLLPHMHNFNNGQGLGSNVTNSGANPYQHHGMLGAIGGGVHNKIPHSDGQDSENDFSPTKRTRAPRGRRMESLTARANALTPVEGVRFDPYSYSWFAKYLENENSKEPKISKYLLKKWGFNKAHSLAVHTVKCAYKAVPFTDEELLNIFNIDAKNMMNNGNNQNGMININFKDNFANGAVENNAPHFASNNFGNNNLMNNMVMINGALGNNPNMDMNMHAGNSGNISNITNISNPINNNFPGNIGAFKNYTTPGVGNNGMVVVPPGMNNLAELNAINGLDPNGVINAPNDNKIMDPSNINGKDANLENDNTGMDGRNIGNSMNNNINQVNKINGYNFNNLHTGGIGNIIPNNNNVNGHSDNINNYAQNIDGHNISGEKMNSVTNFLIDDNKNSLEHGGINHVANNNNSNNNYNSGNVINSEFLDSINRKNNSNTNNNYMTPNDGIRNSKDTNNENDKINNNLNNGINYVPNNNNSVYGQMDNELTSHNMNTISPSNMTNDMNRNVLNQTYGIQNNSNSHGNMKSDMINNLMDYINNNDNNTNITELQTRTNNVIRDRTNITNNTDVGNNMEGENNNTNNSYDQNGGRNFNGYGNEDGNGNINDPSIYYMNSKSEIKTE